MLLPGDTKAWVPMGGAGDSPAAREIGALFTQTLIICTVIFAVVATLVVICIVRFRARAGAPEPAQTHGHTGLEIAWTLVPVAIVAALFALTARTMGATDP